MPGKGTLDIELIAGKGLIDLDEEKGGKGSDPYCVFILGKNQVSNHQSEITLHLGTRSDLHIHHPTSPYHDSKLVPHATSTK